MGKTSFSCLCLFVLFAVCNLPSLAHGENQEQATLEGVLRVARKFLYKYYIECASTGQTCALRNSEALGRIRPGSRIRVEGHLGTFHHGGGTKDNPSPFPSAWVMYMAVEKVTVLHEAKAEQLIKPSTPLHRLPRLSLNRYTGDLGNEHLDSIITAQDVERIIVFKNETNAPDELHLYAIERALKANPVIQSFYYFDPNTGDRTRSHKAEVDGFFTALLLAKDEQCVGFEVSRKKVRIFNSDGDGWVLRNPEQAHHHGRTEVHRVLEILDRPHFFKARPEAKRISFEEYKNIKAEFVSKNPRWKPKYAMTYSDKKGKGYRLELESFTEDKVWLAHLTQYKTKGWDWVARYELVRSSEVEQEFRIPQILKQRSRIIGGVQYGMAVADVIANKGEPKEIVHHAEGGSAHLIYEDVKVHVRQWYPQSGRGRVVGVESVVK